MTNVGLSALPEPEPAWTTQPGKPEWYALWTHSRCERLVQDQLVAEGFRTFFPQVEVWVRQSGVRRISRVPMFPGYLFLRHAMDKASYVAASKARGLVRILGERWDRLAVVPEHEIDAVQKVLCARMNPVPYPYLTEGQRVRIRQGPLAGVEGVLVEQDPERGLLVLSIGLFQRSISVEIDCTLAMPA